MTSLYLTGASISYLTQFILALGITLYFCWLRNKSLFGCCGLSQPTRCLAGFMAGVTLYTFMSFIESIIDISWRFPLSILQPTLILLALIPLLQFPYLFPVSLPAQKREAKWVLLLSIMVALFSFAHFWYRWFYFELFSIQEVNYHIEISLIGIEFLWCVVTLLRRTMMLEQGQHASFVSALIDPQSKHAKATRAFALMLSIPLWLTVILLISELYSLYYLEDFLGWLTGFSWKDYLDFVIIFAGVLIFLLSFVITYLNHSTDASSFMVKLVGISLGTMLMVLGIAALNLAILHQTTYQNKQLIPHQSVRFEPLPSGGYHISKIPFKFDDALGTPLSLNEKDNVAIELGFTFPFYDRTWSQAHMQKDGALSFGQEIDPDVFRFKSLSIPVIAPLYVQFNKPYKADMGLFSKQEADRVTLTWYKLCEKNGQANVSNTFQLVLYANGVFEINYKELNIRQMYLNDHHRRIHFAGLISGQSNQAIEPDQAEISLASIITYLKQAIEDESLAHHQNLKSAVDQVFDFSSNKPEAIRFQSQLPYISQNPYGVIENYQNDFREDLHRQMLPLAYLIIACTLFIGIGFPRFFQSNLVKPLDALLLGMKEVNDGNLNVHIAAQYNDEIGMMSNSFNRMVQSLRQSEALKDELNWALIRSNEELELGVMQRTAELMQSKEEAEEAKNKAEIANQAKSEFLSNMSHELRTPLNGILGYTQILQQSANLEECEQNSLKIIHQSGNHLLTLINDILDLAKIEARKMELYPTDFHLGHFLAGIVGMMQMRTELAVRHVGLLYEPDPALPIGVQADEKRLRQVLLNLLSNAIKFTHQGMVTLSVTLLEHDGINGKIRFEVTDTGVGIAKDKLELIFLPFEQAGKPKERAEGTGLGLSITRQLVDLMGSEIHVESELGKGSTFAFDLYLPVIMASREEPQNQPSNPSHQPHLLQKEITSAQPSHRREWIVPAKEELETLYELAILGKMSAIRKQIAHIEQQDERFVPFSRQIRQLARAFEDEEIVALIEPYLQA